MSAEPTSAFEIYKALGDATRFRIFLALAQSGEPLFVNAIAAQLKLSQPAVSQHLKILKAAGIAHASRNGRKIHYLINRELIRNIMQRVISLVQMPENLPVSPFDKIPGQV